MRKKKVVRPALAKDTQIVKDLQKQADEITTTSFTPPLPPAKLSPLPEKPIVPLTQIQVHHKVVVDYTIFVQCLAAISLSVGFVSIGIFIGLVIK